MVSPCFKCMIDMMTMLQTNLHGVDLNLLKLLHALVEERSVTRAGVRLGLSQPAASRALARLRRLLSDRLVVRTPTGLDLTPRALALVEPVRRVLEDMSAIVAPVHFDPGKATGRIRIAAIDRLTALVAPALLARFANTTPMLDLDFVQPVGDNVALVADGVADLALGVFDDLPPGLFRRILYEDDFVCLLRQGHPVLDGAWTAERFAALSHAAVLITGRGEAPVDTALARLGISRRVAIRVPHFLAAAIIVASSDLVLSVPRQLANMLSTGLQVATRELPLALPRVDVAMIWHERRQDDPAHAWLRDSVAEATRAYLT